MSFTEYKFFIFFAIVYATMWVSKFCISDKPYFTTVNKLLLLISSYALTAIVDWKFCISLSAVTLIVYFVSLKITENSKFSKLLMALCITVILIQLGFFKYFNFFSQSIGNLIGTDFVTLNLIAPLGISFYSFSAIGYLIDVYRKKYSANKNFIDVALYISFFTKLVSGPIVKPEKFFGQLDAEHCVSLKNLETGIQIVVLGLFKKMVLADNLSVFVNDVFGVPKAFDSVTILLAMISYSLQIYFDFSGYSDIAIGFSKILGFDFDKNFNLPYASLNPTEFWKRWHISLSQWLQEYLYISLGGNRKGKIRTYINLLLTMLIGGLWHGANFTFIVWGGINGLGLIIHKLFRSFNKKKTESLIAKIISCVFCFCFATITWVFFRAESFGNAADMFIGLTQSEGIRQIYSWSFVAIIFALAEIIIALLKKKHNSEKISTEYIILDLTKISGLALFTIFAGITVLFAYIGNTAFIYGNF
ncbi:MAG: MBOAT family protein [Clostridia bacterium]|nr:MBOAT family protein [Clostridia bacterium]